MANRIGDIENIKSLIGKNENFQRPNLFRVTLPPIKGYDTKDLNLLCKSVMVPGRQLGTLDKQVGMYKYGIVNQMSVSECTMQFHIPTTHLVKNYFQEWQSVMFQKGEVGYYNDYARTIQIEAMKKGATIPVFQKDIPALKKLNPTVRKRLPDIGPFKLSQGEIDLDLGTKDDWSHKCKLIEAIPTTMSDTIMADDQENGLMELTISFKFKEWEAESADARSVFKEILKGDFSSISFF
jgi:hypothetical protein